MSGADMLLQEASRLKKLGGKLIFCGMKNTVKDQLNKLGYLDKLGPENFYLLSDVALEELIPQLDEADCDVCLVRVFKQCPDKK